MYLTFKPLVEIKYGLQFIFFIVCYFLITLLLNDNQQCKNERYKKVENVHMRVNVPQSTYLVVTPSCAIKKELHPNMYPHTYVYVP